MSPVDGRPSASERTPISELERALAASLDGRPQPAGVLLSATMAEQLSTVLQAHALVQSSPEINTAGAKVHDRLGPYRLLRSLGRGGQGSVWLAEDSRLQRRVALKILDRPPTDTSALTRFRREAAISSRLEHPGICTVFDIGTAQGAAYIAMRYVAGPTLYQALAAGTPGLHWLEVIERAARALHVAHMAGVVHRDIKPGNIALDADGQPVLLDFGLAQDATSAGAALTLTDTIVGTPAYLAPERLTSASGDADARSDVWSLAATCFEVVTGSPPFAAPTRDALHHAILHETPGHYLAKPAKLPHALRLVLAVALEKRSKGRYQTALAFADDLRRVRLGEPVSALAAGLWFRAYRRVVRHRLAVAIVATVVAALSTALLVAVGSLANTRAALKRADGLRQLAEAQILVRRDPGSALAAALAGAEAAPLAVANDTLLGILDQVREEQRLDGIGRVGDIGFGRGGVLITAGADGMARTFAPATGQALRTAAVGRSPLLRLAVAGNVIAVADDSGAVTLLDAELHVLRTFSAGGAKITSIAFLGDTRLALGDSDGWLVVVGVTAGDEVFRCRGHDSAVGAATATPDGSALATASVTGDIRTWDLDAGRPRPVLLHADGKVDLCLRADGKRLLAADEDNTAHVFDVATGKELLVLRGHDSCVLSAVFAPDGERIATASFDRSVRLFDGTNGRLDAVLNGHQRAVRRVIFTPDGAHLASVGDDDTVRLWRTGARPGLAVLPHGPWATMAASFDRVGQLLVTTSAGTSAKLWSVATGKLQNEVDHGAPITSACFDDHRRRLLTSGRDGVICAWDLQSGRRLATIAVPGERERQLHMVLDHAGARLLVTSSSGRALLLDAESGEVLHHLSGLSPMHRTGVVARSAFAPDDRVVVTVPADDAQSTLLLTETATGATMATLRGHRGMILSVAFAADGRLVSGAVDGTARIWHLGDPAPLVLTHHDDAVQQARFDPSGARVLTCGSDCTARIFDAATGRELAVLRGHDGMLYCGEFSPDGSKVITASWDGTAAIWDAATGVRLVHQEAHTRPVFSAMFSPDGATAATTSLDGTARLWPVDPLAFARTGAR